jgi:hypothetical protein
MSLALGLSLAGTKVTLAQEVSIGIRGGLNAAYTIFEVEERSSREVRPGLILGGVFSYPLRSWMAIQAEILYAEKGWAAAEQEGGRRVSYLEVPILLRLQHSGRLLPHVLMGPSFGIEVGCSFDEMAGTGRVDCDHPLISLDRPTLDTGFMVGAGLGRAVRSGTLFFDALLSIGLTDVNREPLPWGAQTNIALSLSLAYTVGLGGERGGNR